MLKTKLNFVCLSMPVCESPPFFSLLSFRIFSTLYHNFLPFFPSSLSSSPALLATTCPYAKADTAPDLIYFVPPFVITTRTGAKGRRKEDDVGYDYMHGRLGMLRNLHFTREHARSHVDMNTDAHTGTCASTYVHTHRHTT